MQECLQTRETIRERDIRRILGEPLPWSILKKNSFLVTGAYGLLASPIVETLLAIDSSITVYGLMRNKAKAEEKIPHLLNKPNFRPIYQDVNMPVEIGDSVDYIIHAASPASPKFYHDVPVDVILPNVVGTHHLLSLAQLKGCKGFIYISSGEIYGQLPPEQIMSETVFGPIDPLSPRACYAESKRLGETMCISWFRQYGLPVTIVRPFHTYGPGMDLDDGRVFADFVSNALRGEDIVLKSDGSARRAYCYVSDAVAAIFTAFLAGRPGDVYNIGNDHCVLSVKELGALLLRLASGENQQLKFEIPSIPDATQSVAVSVPDLTKIRALGWQPKVNVDKGFLSVMRRFRCEEKN